MRTFETRRADWIPFPEALERVLAGMPPPSAGAVPLAEAAGLAVADRITSPLTLPPGPTSHMDGYVVRADELSGTSGQPWPRTFQVVGDSFPGSPFDGPIPGGAAVRIMTGALVPADADRVFPVEETDGEAGERGRVRIGRTEDSGGPHPPGRHVRPAGEEVRHGETIADVGDTIDFGLLAVLAATGAATVPAHRRPRIALLATGSELVPAGDAAALHGGVRRADILSPILPLLVRAVGGDPLPPRRVPDDRATLREALSTAAREADLVVTTGGASMGAADIVKDVLDELGFELDFWRIRMRPGSPVGFGRLAGGIPLLSLPGNPVSAVVAFLALAVPAVRALGGHRRRHLPRIRATVLEPLPGPDHLTRFFRVSLEPEGGGRWGARPAAPQGSGAIMSLALADGLAVVPEGSAAPDPGSTVEVLLLPRSGWDENR